jgi:hypothetical protein
MDVPGKQHTRYFTTYTGVGLPFRLVNELSPGEVDNRNTCFIGYFDDSDRLVGFEKRVYGETELTHRYHYSPSGVLRLAEIIDIDGAVATLRLGDDGGQVDQ